MNVLEKGVEIEADGLPVCEGSDPLNRAWCYVNDIPCERKSSCPLYRAHLQKQVQQFRETYKGVEQPVPVRELALVN
jgi:hypothetical protein